MHTTIARRGFVKFAGVGCAALALAATEVAGAQEAELSYDQLVAWDGEYDVVVIGAGLAGLTAAITAADEGATVLVLEKAYEEAAGGNSRMCHQLVATVNDFDGGWEYYNAMRGEFLSTSDEVLRTYVEGMAQMDDYLVSLGANPDEITSWAGCGISTYETEHPELPGGDAFEGHSITPELANGALYDLQFKNLKDRSDKIDYWFEAPAVGLIQDPESKTVLGVAVETNGELLNIRATNGVCLTCGGFENNPAMLESYLGIGGKTTCWGTKFNTGDGIRMAIEAGANLWHMNNYETGSGVCGVFAPGIELIPLFFAQNVAANIVVGPDGTRYAREGSYPAGMRHGHLYIAGDWTWPSYVSGSWGIVDQAGVEASGSTAMVEAGVEDGSIVKADTVEELAELCGLTYLADTIEIYNRYCENGFDEAFRRDPACMVAFGDGPFYGVRMDTRIVLNTQGGPERDENAQIIDGWGEPIPHLYGAGELGGVTAHRYQGGGNVAECLVFGRIAGKNAAAAKDPLPPFSLTAREQNPTYTKGVRNDIA